MRRALVLIPSVGALLALGLGALGTFAAARSFARGDYLRRAWGLFAVCYGCLFLDVLLFGASSPFRARAVGEHGALISGALILTGNLCASVSLIIVSRAWKVAGLVLSVSRRTFWVAELLLLAVVLALLGPTALSQAAQVVYGHLDASRDLASTLGDGFAFSMLGPIFFTARSLRGGTLAWPWGLMAVNVFSWMLVDAADILGAALHLAPGTQLVALEVLRASAGLSLFAAGLAQRAIVRDEL
ncbi:MAG: hypothetical protein ACOZQL_15560 [Myxococcota bacterium]